MKVFEKYLSPNKKHICYNILGFKYSTANMKYYDEQNEILDAKIDHLQSLLNYALDITKCPPARGILRKQQLEILEIFKMFVKVCKQNNLVYWLDFGTLIGAVHHKGFIPWDNDIDCCMLRDDYLKVIPLLHKVYENTDYYVREVLGNHFQIRIERKDNTLVGFDIFPIDKYSASNLSESQIHDVRKDIEKATDVLKSYQGEFQDTLSVQKYRDYIKELQRSEILKGQEAHDENPTLFYALDYPHCYEMHFHLVMNWENIFPLQDLEFEGELFSVPNKYDQHLKNIFGGSYLSFPW